MGKSLVNLSAGKALFNWLANVQARPTAWSLGALANRAGFGAWMVFLVRSIHKDQSFLAEVIGMSDPWQRSKSIGMKISEIAKEFRKLSEAEKADLAREAETELRSGMALLAADKQKILELLNPADPPRQ
jgi:hypothetical protein